MNFNFYEQLIKESPLGYAYHKILCDENGKPCDYEFVEINDSFEKLTGLNRKDVIGKKITSVMPGILKEEFDWISFYGGVALTGEKKEFEQYSEPLKRFYSIKVFSPEKYYFVTVFSDITVQMQMINISKNFIEYSGMNIDYQKICDDILLLSGAKYAAFNLFEENGLDFYTAGISGISSSINKAIQMLGFNPNGRKWKHDPARLQKIKGQLTTCFGSLSDLAGDVIPKKVVNSLERIFGIGQVAIIKIEKDGRMLGDFTILMDKGETLQHKSMLEIYATEVGLFLEQKKFEEEVRFLSNHDHLTGVHNRRYYDAALERLDNEQYYPLTLVMADVNGLKLTNDAFGHDAGDKILQKIADILRRECRSQDIVARIGGDEFVILLPRTDAKNAEIILKRINKAIAGERFGSLVLSLSVGFAVKEEPSADIQDIFKQAEDDMYRRKLKESANMRNNTVELIMNSLFEKNSGEKLHSRNVGNFCEAIAKAMDLPADEICQIRIAGQMHDIGKIGISDETLKKPGKLLANEWQEVKRHSEIGYRILCAVNEYADIAGYVLEHHEKMDGSGYPKGLKGQEISLQARILSLADSFDAMTADRVYRESLNPREAIEEIKKCCGTQFDSEIAKVFITKVLGETW